MLFKKKKISAFTLIELLVVIVIIGILASIGVAQFNEHQASARSVARISQANSVSKIIALGDLNRSDEYQYIFNESDLQAILADQGLSIGFPGNEYCVFYIGLKGSKLIGAYPDDFIKDNNEFAVLTWDSKNNQPYAYGTGNVTANYNNWGLVASDFLCSEKAVSCPVPTIIFDNSGDTCYLTESHADCSSPQNTSFSFSGSSTTNLNVCLEDCSHPGITFSIDSGATCSNSGGELFNKISAIIVNSIGTSNSDGEQVQGSTASNFNANQNWIEIQKDGTMNSTTNGASGR
jgi:prepilin-type N-terminal cleavage/methylation domain-containing protein